MMVVQNGNLMGSHPYRNYLKNKSKIRTRTETKPVKAKHAGLKKARDPGRLRFFGMIRNKGNEFTRVVSIVYGKILEGFQVGLWIDILDPGNPENHLNQGPSYFQVPAVNLRGLYME